MKRIRLGANVIPVRYRHDLTDDNGRACWGLWCGQTNEILLAKALKHLPDKRRIIKLHEVIHAIDDAHGLDLREEQVARLAECLTQYLRDNTEEDA